MTKLKLSLLWLMALLYVGAGTNHFVNPDIYVQIMPPYLPWHLSLVLLSGVAEIGLGVALLVPKARRAAAWGVIALLIAVFPANVHMALSPEAYPGVATIALYIRLPVQALLIAWAWWFTRPRTESTPTVDPRTTADVR